MANRVSEIQSRLPNGKWRHVSTEDNPADCALRGIFGDELPNHHLWWHGSPRLRYDADQWPCHDIILSPEVPLEERILSMQCHPVREAWDLASRYFSWPKLIRVTAYVVKFTRRCRLTLKSCRNYNFSSPIQYSASKSIILSAAECNAAKTFWIKTIQAELFLLELNSLANGQSLSAKSSLLSL